MREQWRRLRTWRWLDDMLWDLRYALRMFQRSRGFTAAMLVTVALGIAVNATVFTVTNAMLFNGFPRVDPDNRIRYIISRGDQSGGVSFPDFKDWAAQSTSFDGIAAVGNGGLRLLVADQNGSPETYDGTQISVNAFQVLRQAPILGRNFAPADGASGPLPSRF